MSAIEWRIRVKALMESGVEREFQVDVLSDETVGDFRGRLATKSQVEPQKQRLIYHGRLLVDDAQKLVDVGVSNGSALHMVARPTAAAAPTATTSAERGNSGARDERGALPSSQQQTPFGLTPLAAQVMDQTLNRLRTGVPQSDLEARQRVIQGISRDFGADNGGEWVASTAGPLSYVINREAAPWSSLTEEEFRRGGVRDMDSVSRGSNVDAYMPIPGLVSNDSQLSRQSEHPPFRAQASRAQANELVYELRENLLPALRRLPGHENYDYSSTSPSGPHYLGQATTNPIEVVGEALSGLGDAFVELGRSLQSVGSQWQNRNSLQPGAAYSPEQMHNILQALRQLVRTTSVTTPFLQTTLAQTPSEQPATTAAPANSTLLQMSPYQAATLMSNHRRTRRLQSVDVAMDMPRSRAQATVEIEFTMTPMSTNTRDSQQPQPQLQPQPQPRPRMHPDPTGSVPFATLLANAGQQLATNAQTAANNTSGAESREGFVQLDPSLSLQSIMEQFHSRVSRMFQDGSPGPDSVGTSVQPPLDASRSGQTGPQVDTSAAASNASNSDANAGFAGFVDRLSTLGSQTARSDRSNLSTTTEYGSVIDATNRAPRFFAMNLGGNSNIGQILPGLMQPNNPFSIASIFLGTEAATTASTSRRAS
ncbi:hypothetical protein FBU31_004951, partial [Coemansia sp. 'formosensis']